MPNKLFTKSSRLLCWRHCTYINLLNVLWPSSFLSPPSTKQNINSHDPPSVRFLLEQTDRPTGTRFTVLSLNSRSLRSLLERIPQFSASEWGICLPFSPFSGHSIPTPNILISCTLLIDWHPTLVKLRVQFLCMPVGCRRAKNRNVLNTQNFHLL